MSYKEELIKIYIERGAVLLGNFSLTGGGSSNIYIDGRLVTTYPKSLMLIADEFLRIISSSDEFSDDLNIVVPPVSGISIAAVLSVKLGMPFIIDRGREKEHGTGKRFEGILSNNPACVLVDDLITKGTTLVKSIEALRGMGKVISNALVVVDREEGGREILESLDVKLHALITKSELVAALQKTKR